MAPKRTIPRRRPLHTCGVSILAITQKAFSQSQNLKGAIGFIARKMTTISAAVKPFVYFMQIQWITTVLVFIDDWFLATENFVERLFSPASIVFDKIDELIKIVESLPRSSDNLADKFAMIIHRVPFLDSAIVHVISWLNSSWREEEKEIMIDMNWKQSKSGDSLSAEASVEREDREKTINFLNSPHGDVLKCTYKDILQKGMKKNEDNEEEKAGDESIAKDNPILELFESAWHMKPRKETSPSSPICRAT